MGSQGLRLKQLHFEATPAGCDRVFVLNRGHHPSLFALFSD